jgi:EAL domain-containing protein (putative c-di-GMP-specific phosphodiesterase class I)
MELIRRRGPALLTAALGHPWKGAVAELRRAVRNGEFLLHYQPKVQLPTGRVVEAEALLRWNHPERGLLRPPAFLTLAEETGLIVPIGVWVLRTATEQVADWERRGRRIGACINFSPRELAHPALLGQLDAALTAAGVDGSRLNLEVTEHAAVADLQSTTDTIEAFRSRGMHVALDDFGTGFSSLTWLQQLPVDFLKLDQTFTGRLGEHSPTTTIVSAVIDMGHALGLTIIAEGVETEAQKDELVRLGCDQAQGYYYSPPLPAERVAQVERL